MTESLKQIQQQFMAYLIGERSEIADSVDASSRQSIEKKLQIYSNAYRIRLTEVIDTDHSILGSYLGDDLFDEMVEGYIKLRPSSSFSLRQYANALPEYLSNVDPFTQHPQISELARFERTLLNVFDAADSIVAKDDALTEIAAEQWPSLEVRLHPSTQVFYADYNSVEIWQKLKIEQSPPDVVKKEQTWLLWRNAKRTTEFGSIDSPECILFESILKGQNLAQLCESLLSEVNEEQIAERVLNVLSLWLKRGMVSGFVVEGTN